MQLRKALLFTLGIVFGSLCIYGVYRYAAKDIITPLGNNITRKINSKPLEQYSFESLKKRNISSANITFGKQLKDEDSFSQYIFYYNVDGKKVSGLANIPKKINRAPIIVMFRGFVDPEIYKTGIGTIRASEVLATNGFITLAPDFLGYGESDNPSKIVIEERFQTYTTALTLISSLSSLQNAIDTIPENSTISDIDSVGLWGHSNGGHIALSVLAITGKKYPTVLWAPVSKPFPYSILYFTDEFEDHGKALRKIVADFEKDYDAEKYSPPNYYSDIATSLQIHQGSADDAVPLDWSNELVESLQSEEKDVEYYIYQGEDHNFANGGWQTVVDRNITFFKNHL